jgi:hypothetical protein
MAACQPDETAYDGVYTEMAVFMDTFDKHLTFYQGDIPLGEDHQKTLCLDTTKIRCFNPPGEGCSLSLAKLCQTMS